MMALNSNNKTFLAKYILMVGPNLADQGGVSRVVKTWYDANFFHGFRFNYVSSTSDRLKLISIIKGFVTYVYYIITQYPDIIYIHCSAFKSFYRKSLYILFASIFRHKIILHIHPTRFYDFYSSLAGLAIFYSNFILKRVHTFVVLTEEMRVRISDNFPEKHVYTLSNPVNVQALANKNNIKRLEAKVLYLGWVISLKGVYELVDAMGILKQKMPSVHLNFFGAKEIIQLRNYVNDKGLNSEITVNDWIGEEDKIRQLYTSTLLVLPSHSEGIPNVILEAMATKTPIVATHVGGLKEILRDRENALIVNVGDPMDLSDKILTLLRDKPLRMRLANNAYREAKNHYDVFKVKKQFIQIIESVCL